MNTLVWLLPVAGVALVATGIAAVRRRARRRRPLTREEKLAAARQAARGLRRSARRAGPGLSDTESARPNFNWGSYSGGPPTDAGGSGWAD
ncbi:hypothetical protein ACGFI9_33735 [Micromonospora sp. NPDC048930]|uniref:hypothetical protein n=1 Tax=Micromonospora sp. NPDC048930 TaxID=3364261 RepID=UPI0037129A7E